MRFERKSWETELFGREIQELRLDTGTVKDELRRALAAQDECGTWGIEVNVDAPLMGEIPTLEDVGFRLVDSKITFITRLERADIPEVILPQGRLREVTAGDLAAVSELTLEGLVDNPRFYSRFKHADHFSRRESARYFDAFNLRSFREQPELFTVWEVDGRVVGYFNYMRKSHDEFDPLYKGVLTAVSPQFRGFGVQNVMQNHLFTLFGESSWWIDNTTQVSNLAALKNHTKAGKRIHNTSLILFRVNSRNHPGGTDTGEPHVEC